MLRKQLIRLAYQNPNLRETLLPLVQSTVHTAKITPERVGSKVRIVYAPYGEIVIPIVGHETHFTDLGAQAFVEFYKVELPDGKVVTIHPSVVHRLEKWEPRSPYDDAFRIATAALKKAPFFHVLERKMGHNRGILGYDVKYQQTVLMEDAERALLSTLPHARKVSGGISFAVPVGDVQTKTFLVFLEENWSNSALLKRVEIRPI